MLQEFYASRKTSRNCVPHNPKWDADVSDDQVKDPVIHGAPIKNQQSSWDDLKQRYAKQYKAYMQGKAQWAPYWALREKERNIYRK